MQNPISVSISSVLERTQFFTGFHKIWRAEQKCGRVQFNAYCFWDKMEVDIRFWRCANSHFCSFSVAIAAFFTDRQKNPNRIKINERCLFLSFTYEYLGWLY